MNKSNVVANALKDIRGFLANFEKTAHLAWDFNIPEEDLIKIAFAYGILWLCLQDGRVS